MLQILILIVSNNSKHLLVPHNVAESMPNVFAFWPSTDKAAALRLVGSRLKVKQMFPQIIYHSFNLFRPIWRNFWNSPFDLFQNSNVMLFVLFWDGFLLRNRDEEFRDDVFDWCCEFWGWEVWKFVNNLTLHSKYYNM